MNQTRQDLGRARVALSGIGYYAQSLGIDVANLPESQAYEAIVNRLAPSLRVAGTGAQSDFELKNFLKQMPQIENTPGGNELITATLEGFYRNKQKAAEIAAMALNGDIKRPEAEKMLRELPDPMAAYRQFMRKTKPEATGSSDALRKKYGLQ